MKAVPILVFFLFAFGFSYGSCEPLNRDTTTHFYVKGRFLYAPDGEKVILRGINHMNVVSDPSGKNSFPEIAKTGANTVRIMWMAWGGYGDKLDTLIGNCIKFHMIPIIELHDATGKWEKLPVCVAFWLRADVQATIKKYQHYLLLNIGNEIGDDKVSQEAFYLGYKKAILALRNASLNVPLIIDAANYGRNEQYLLQNGSRLLDADPLHNLIFSWHPYDAGAPEARIQQAIDKSIQLKIVLMIGEFAPFEVACKCCIPYQFILCYCQQNEIGWLAWSWGPGNSDCGKMDMTKNGSFDSLYDWGREVALTSPYSIKNTAIVPHIFAK